MMVMLVDDSPTLLASMESVLRRAGHDVVKSLSAEEALSKLKAGTKPRLVITDLNMGGMNGIDFIRQAKKVSGMAFTPMLMLTTESQQARRAEAKAAGAAGWLVKPVAADALIGVVKQLVPA
ncbi:response regulator [Consotaella salsifontis]|uniref:Two-component system, chemotaxis family, response regulator CheY n=1 Tax=Consotaella salsifontis TaxID=1365950 RepID=A0A1T4STB6_9HYPH|nr:response regulator [Consotaella salsifontis]SKA31504.1 two-component system, chemotaxis family, response regulator CheY [Consotaella salsifontis]